MKKKEGATPAEPCTEGVKLTWTSTTTQRESGTCIYRDWTTSCGRYRATEIIPKYGAPKAKWLIEYGATYREEGNRWWVCETKTPYVGFYPQHYTSLPQAMRACEKFHAKRCKVDVSQVEDNREEVASLAEGSPQDQAPPTPKTKAAKTAEAPQEEEGQEESPATPAPTKKVKEETTEEPKTKARFSILGRPATLVIRWMGAQGWSKAEVRKVLDKLNLPVKDKTIECQLRGGKNHKLYGPPPKLGKEEAKQLNALAGRDS